MKPGKQDATEAVGAQYLPVEIEYSSEHCCSQILFRDSDGYEQRHWVMSSVLAAPEAAGLRERLSSITCEGCREKLPLYHVDPRYSTYSHCRSKADEILALIAAPATQEKRESSRQGDEARLKATDVAHILVAMTESIKWKDPDADGHFARVAERLNERLAPQEPSK